MQLTGKAMQTTKGILQIDGKAHPSVNVIQTAQGGLSTINIIPQGGNATVVSLSEAAQTTKSNSSTGQCLHSLFFYKQNYLAPYQFQSCFLNLGRNLYLVCMLMTMLNKFLKKVYFFDNFFLHSDISFIILVFDIDKCYILLKDN